MSAVIVLHCGTSFPYPSNGLQCCYSTVSRLPLSPMNTTTMASKTQLLFYECLIHRGRNGRISLMTVTVASHICLHVHWAGRLTRRAIPQVCLASQSGCETYPDKLRPDISEAGKHAAETRFHQVFSSTRYLWVPHPAFWRRRGGMYQ